MKVGYNPVWGVSMIVVGALCFLLGLWVTLLGDFSPLVIAGPLLLVLGTLQVTMPYFEYDPRTRTITIKALIGPMSRRFGESEGGRLGIEGDRIVYTRPDGKTKAPVSRVMAKRDDWNAVMAQLS